MMSAAGSGYKLVHMFEGIETTGVDLPETIERIRHRYPDRRWISGTFENMNLPPADLVICADVVEHVADPDALMHALAKATR